ncbi:MAG: hypothetical protein KDK65_00400 [Chlamydiia bacterium]|nr:hypothetical protein [Chlamydiia bacterium]
MTNFDTGSQYLSQQFNQNNIDLTSYSDQDIELLAQHLDQMTDVVGDTRLFIDELTTYRAEGRILDENLLSSLFISSLAQQPAEYPGLPPPNSDPKQASEDFQAWVNDFQQASQNMEDLARFTESTPNIRLEGYQEYYVPDLGVDGNAVWDTFIDNPVAQNLSEEQIETLADELSKFLGLPDAKGTIKEELEKLKDSNTRLDANKLAMISAKALSDASSEDISLAPPDLDPDTAAMYLNEWIGESGVSSPSGKTPLNDLSKLIESLHVRDIGVMNMPGLDHFPVTEEGMTLFTQTRENLDFGTMTDQELSNFAQELADYMGLPDAKQGIENALQGFRDQDKQLNPNLLAAAIGAGLRSLPAGTLSPAVPNLLPIEAAADKLINYLQGATSTNSNFNVRGVKNLMQASNISFKTDIAQIANLTVILEDQIEVFQNNIMTLLPASAHPQYLSMIEEITNALIDLKAAIREMQAGDVKKANALSQAKIERVNEEIRLKQKAIRKAKKQKKKGKIVNICMKVVGALAMAAAIVVSVIAIACLFIPGVNAATTAALLPVIISLMVIAITLMTVDYIVTETTGEGMFQRAFGVVDMAMNALLEELDGPDVLKDVMSIVIKATIVVAITVAVALASGGNIGVILQYGLMLFMGSGIIENMTTIATEHIGLPPWAGIVIVVAVMICVIVVSIAAGGKGIGKSISNFTKHLSKVITKNIGKLSAAIGRSGAAQSDDVVRAGQQAGNSIRVSESAAGSASSADDTVAAGARTADAAGDTTTAATSARPGGQAGAAEESASVSAEVGTEAAEQSATNFSQRNPFTRLQNAVANTRMGRVFQEHPGALGWVLGMSEATASGAEAAQSAVGVYNELRLAKYEMDSAEIQAAIQELQGLIKELQKLIDQLLSGLPDQNQWAESVQRNVNKVFADFSNLASQAASANAA